MFLILYKLIISPIEYLIENIFSFFYYYLQLELGITIFFVSFAVTMLCLPFYYRAEKISEEEKEKLSQLKPYIDKIKKNFNGDEQFFMLQTLYRQHNYNPIMALRNSFSLFLQIPFFIAAYHFFSNLELFSGYSWGFIKDYSQPDMLLNIGSLKINALPLLMTLINFASCEIYLKTKSLKTRIQPYLLSLFFLIFLYNSPSGLVLYWTYNNFFYLLKNKFMDDKKPYKFVYYLVLFVILIFLFCKQNDFRKIKNNIFELVCNLSPCLFIFGILKLLKNDLINISEKLSDKFNIIIVLLCGFGMVLLQGLIIPLGLLTSDLSMFVIELDNTNNIIKFVLENIFCITGLYLFWGTISFSFVSKKCKIYYIVIFLSLFLFSILSYLTFGKNLGTVDTNLQFENEAAVRLMSGNLYTQGTNIFIFIGFLALIIYIFKKSYVNHIIIILLIVLFSEMIVSGIEISKFIKGINYIDNWNKKNKELWVQSDYIKLSKTNKNVIIIFLDRFLGALLPKILEEKPELKDVYSGFVFYPNTVSYALNTVLGYPACVGGYEYTPFKLDNDKRLFPEKWLEASLMLPTLFKNNGYLSTVVDPLEESELIKLNYTDIYSSKGINIIKMMGKHNSKMQFDKMNDSEIQKQIKKRLYYYSFLIIVPNNLKKIIYNDGFYLLKRRLKELRNHNNSSEKRVMNSYSALTYLKYITKTDSLLNTFTIIHNDLSHCLFLFQYPDYEYLSDITNYGENKYNDLRSFKGYHTAMASFLLVAQYLDYLKQSGVYDNSKIIIMADHGNPFVHLPDFSNFNNDNVLQCNPLLMVKDFNQQHSLKNDYTFMTNADVPSIASKDLFTNAKNPFTGKDISSDEKQKGATIYFDLHFRNFSQFTTNKAILDKFPIIKHVKDNIFNENNWTDVNYSFSE